MNEVFEGDLTAKPGELWVINRLQTLDEVLRAEQEEFNRAEDERIAWPGDEKVRHALLCAESGSGKAIKVLAAALRAKSAECDRLREAVEHFFGKADLDRVEHRAALAPRAEEPEACDTGHYFCTKCVFVHAKLSPHYELHKSFSSEKPAGEGE